MCNWKHRCTSRTATSTQIMSGTNGKCKEALHMADIRRKATSATQTALSHLRRESETQVYLPKDVATNTAVNRGTNPIRLKKYNVGTRGEPQQMKVAEVKFDLK